MDIFTELSLIIVIAFAVSVVMRLLKQPLIIGYILTGLIVGPYFFDLLTSTQVIEVFSKLGMIALLFIVGIGLNPKVIKEVGVPSFVTGVGQVLFTTLGGFFIGKLLGFGTVEALYIAIALTFSSTIIILKLLSDKGDLNKLYGRISVGFLLIQDLIATVVLVVVSSLGNEQISTALLGNVAVILGKGLVLLLVLLAFSHFVLSRFTNFLAKSQEFLFVAALAWGIGIALVYYKVGLSIEIGALVAGIALSITPYAHEVSSRFKPLRDFFIILFFILLGYHMVLDNWQHLLIPTMLFSTFVLIGNPLIVLVLMNLLGYTKRTGFFAGLTVAQISEFSLILVALGGRLGHLSGDILSLVTLVGLITIAGSTYLILYSDKLYILLSKPLGTFEIRKQKKKTETSLITYDAIIFGYKRAGPEFAHVFAELNGSYLAVDFNPHVISKLEKQGIQAIYGDADDIEFLQELPLNEVKYVISTIPDYEVNMMIIKTTLQVNPNCVLIVMSETLEHAERLYEAGATHVVLPHYVGAHLIAKTLLDYNDDLEKHNTARQHHIAHLKKLRALSL